MRTFVNDRYCADGTALDLCFYFISAIFFFFSLSLSLCTCIHRTFSISYSGTYNIAEARRRYRYHSPQLKPADPKLKEMQMQIVK